MAKKFEIKEAEEIRKALEEKKAVIGKETVLKALKASKLSKVYLASNAPLDLEEDLGHYSDVEVTRLSVPNDEFGVLCKRPFFISVLGIE